MRRSGSRSKLGEAEAQAYTRVGAPGRRVWAAKAKPGRTGWAPAVPALLVSLLTLICPPVTLWNSVLCSRLPRQAVRLLDGSLTSSENTDGRWPHRLGDPEGDGDADGDAEGVADGDEEAEGDALGDADGDGCATGAGCSAGAGVAGSGPGGGAAIEISSITASAARPAATGTASVSDPSPGRAPVLCAEFR